MSSDKESHYCTMGKKTGESWTVGHLLLKIPMFRIEARNLIAPWVLG